MAGLSSGRLEHLPAGRRKKPLARWLAACDGSGMIIGLANMKGGVGKSTIAVHLAVWLFERGFRTALLDCDSQQSASVWGSEAEPKLAVAVATSPEEVAQTAVNLAALNEVVVIDAPGGLDERSRTCLLLCDLAIFPITPSILDLRSVSQATAVLNYARTINAGRPEGRLVLNRIRNRETISRELRAAAPNLGLDVCGSVLRDLKAYRDAAQQGTVVHRMGPIAAEPAREMTTLFQELLQDVLGERVAAEQSISNKEQRLNERKTHAG